MSVIINCDIRNQTGSRFCQALRDKNFVPATIYGPGKESVHVFLTQREIEKNIKHLSDNSIIALTLGESGNKSEIKSYEVIVKSFDLHPVTDKVTHIDFFFISDNESAFKVPLVFLNRDTSTAIKLGGVLNIVKRKIPVKCKPQNLPNKIEIDIKNHKVGDSVRISDILLPDGVFHIIRDPKSAIATLLGKKAKVDKAVVAESEESKAPAKVPAKVPAKAPAKAPAKPATK